MLTKAKKRNRNTGIVNYCAMILKREGPMPVRILRHKLDRLHHIDLMSDELAQIIRTWNPGRIKTEKLSYSFRMATNVYYVEENTKGLSWWMNGITKYKDEAELLSHYD